MRVLGWPGKGRLNALAVYVHQQKTWVPVPEQGGGEKACGGATPKRKTSVYLIFSWGGSSIPKNQDLSRGDKWMKIDRYMRKQGLWMIRIYKY